MQIYTNENLLQDNVEPHLKYTFSKLREVRTMLDDLLFNHIDTYFWVGGGVFRRFINKEDFPFDIDCYFQLPGDMVIVKDYLVNNGGKVLFDTDNAIHIEYKGFDFDLVKILSQSPRACINKFDFTICCGAMDQRVFYCQDTFIDDVLDKRLKINEILSVETLLSRFQKFCRRGYFADNDTLCEIFNAIQDSGDDLSKDKINVAMKKVPSGQYVYQNTVVSTAF